MAGFRSEVWYLDPSAVSSWPKGATNCRSFRRRKRRQLIWATYSTNDPLQNKTFQSVGELRKAQSRPPCPKNYFNLTLHRLLSARAGDQILLDVLMQPR